MENGNTKRLRLTPLQITKLFKDSELYLVLDDDPFKPVRVVSEDGRLIKEISTKEAFRL